jgi:hypothetical protein
MSMWEDYWYFLCAFCRPNYQKVHYKFESNVQIMITYWYAWGKFLCHFCIEVQHLH